MARPELSSPWNAAVMGVTMRDDIHSAGLSRLLRGAAAHVELDLSGPEVTLAPEARNFVLCLVTALSPPERGQSVVLKWHLGSDGLRLEWRTRLPVELTPELAQGAGAVGAAINLEEELQGYTFIPKTHVTLDEARPRVLVVEDSPLIAMDLADILVEQGSGEVIVATSVEEAREALAGQRFDIVMLDVSLGQERSDVLLAEMREAWVVVVSGHLAEVLPSSFAGLPFLGKPFQPLHVRDMLLNWSDNKS